MTRTNNLGPVRSTLGPNLRPRQQTRIPPRIAKELRPTSGEFEHTVETVEQDTRKGRR